MNGMDLRGRLAWAEGHLSGFLSGFAAGAGAGFVAGAGSALAAPAAIFVLTALLAGGAR